MPPKSDNSSKKSEIKAKQKILEDKTFGLKNKNKSAKVTKYVNQLEQNLLGATKAKKAQQDIDLKKRKEEEERKKAEISQLFKPVVTQPKVPFGVDPKSVLCAFFKAGQCAKGEKCKYSHDLNVERKALKPDLFTDSRDAQADGKAADTIDKWDQGKLEEVINKKHGGHGMKPTTDIVCKFFIDAVEQKKYGWFWECPNGGDKCHYRHALPADYVFKTVKGSKGGDDDETEKISLEEFLETERFKVGSNTTPVTFESFMKWKSERKQKKAQEELSKKAQREAEINSGKGAAVSGREIFQMQPDKFLIADDEEAMDVDYAQREDAYDNAHDPSLQNASSVQDESLFLDGQIENLDLSSDSEDEAL